MKLFNFLLSFFKLNKGNIYRELVILSSISQNLRRPIHKNLFVKYLKKIYLYLNLFKRIILIYIIKYFVGGFFIKNNSRPQKDLIILYPNDDKWILRGIARDLGKELIKIGLEVKYIPIKDLNKNLDAKNFLFISHLIAQNSIKRFPIILPRSSVLILHLRTISKSEVEFLSRFKYILCQSNLDQMRLSSLGFLPGRVINLPVGVDKNIFSITKSFSEREYDFLISSPYKIDNLGSHYWLRKSTPILVELIKKLSLKGFKIMILGENWNSYNFCSNNIKSFSPPYEEKSYYINQCKCFINISILEGGPVTLLESISCGCFCITKNCGFGHLLSENFKANCKLIPNYTNSDTLTNEIIKIYISNINNHNKNNIDSLKLQEYSYEGLSIKLKKILFE